MAAKLAISPNDESEVRRRCPIARKPGDDGPIVDVETGALTSSRRLVGHDSGEDRDGEIVCNRYRIEQTLALGTHSAVYRASRVVGGFIVLKIASPYVASHAALRTNFAAGYLLVNRLQHPGFVELYDFDYDAAWGSRPLIVMQFHSGGSVAELRGRRDVGLVPRKVAAIACKLASEISFLHENGIIHAAINPYHILVRASGGVVLTGFGCAVRRGSALRWHRRVESEAPYRAPELASDTRPTEQCDIFSLGATMLMMLTGRAVRAGVNLQRELASASSKAGRSADFATPVPADLIEVIDRALRPSPADRWRSAEAMQNALAQVVHRIG